MEEECGDAIRTETSYHGDHLPWALPGFPLGKDLPFNFDDVCLTFFTALKNCLVSAPIILPPDWDLPFELMCDASDFAVGVVLGQRHGKVFHPIYYTSKTLNGAQLKYTILRMSFW